MAILKKRTEQMNEKEGNTAQRVNPATAKEADVCDYSCGFCVGSICPRYDPPDRYYYRLICED